ncbi:MAG: DUF4465 domain-containing protein [Chitinophagaceae bacterium]|nr:DUF4465 domain-containing protein [Chitinophagaceae bacterium]
MAITLFMATQAMAQNIADFENLTLPSSNYWKGVAAVPTVSTFTSSIFNFTNAYDTAYGGSWSGFGYSALSDSMNVSYATNEMAAFPAIGASNSTNYGVAYESYNPTFNKITFSPAAIVGTVQLCNTTIAYRSMQNGDGYAKKFGGLSGNDSDYFKITFTGWKSGVYTNELDFYLADFRDSNNVNDYIIKDWTYFNLFGLGIIDSLTFKMYSSDTNSFGIKTPAYFCLDNLISGVESSDDFQQLLDVKTYPNPFSQYIQCQNNTSNEVNIAISDIQGRICLQEKIIANQSTSLTTYNLQQGIYFLKMSDGKHTFTKKIIKSLD